MSPWATISIPTDMKLFRFQKVIALKYGNKNDKNNCKYRRKIYRKATVL